MKMKNTILFIALFGTMIQPTFAQQILHGDQRYACEAVLCLSSGVQPAECSPSLQRYYSIVRPKYSWTMAARLAFLKQCPASNMSIEMQNFVDVLNSGVSGGCDAANLNRINYIRTGDETGYISSTMPAHCLAYVNHQWTRLDDVTAKYVGEELKGGRWVPANEYERAKAEYDKKQEEKKKEYESCLKRVGDYFKMIGGVNVNDDPDIARKCAAQVGQSF